VQFWLIKKSHAKDSAKAQRKRARGRETERERASVFVCVLFVLDLRLHKIELATLAGS
jgi:hypothetical protein